MSDLEKLAALTIDRAYRIHHDLGPGLLESVYETLLAVKLTEAGVRVERQKPIPIQYEGIRIREGFRADLLIDRCLVVEVKSTERLAAVSHQIQILPLALRPRRPLSQAMGQLRPLRSAHPRHSSTAAG